MPLPHPSHSKGIPVLLAVRETVGGQNWSLEAARGQAIVAVPVAVLLGWVGGGLKRRRLPSRRHPRLEHPERYTVLSDVREFMFGCRKCREGDETTGWPSTDRIRRALQRAQRHTGGEVVTDPASHGDGVGRAS